MTRLKFRTRIAIGFVATSLVVVGASFVAFRKEFRESLVRNETPGMRRVARRVARRHFQGEPLRRRRVPGARPSIGFVLLSFGGDVLSADAGGAPDLTVPEWLVEQAVARQGRISTETLPAADGRPVRAVAFAVEPPERATSSAPLVVVTYRSMDDVETHAEDEIREALTKSLPLSLLAALIVAWLVSRSLARPLARMAREASDASVRPESPRVRGSGARDELDALADVINDSFDRLRRAYERQGRFTSNAAHELRTPVSAILGRAEVVLRRERPADDYRAALEDIQSAAQRAERLVESLLQLARLDAAEALVREPVEMDDLVRSQARQIRDRRGADEARITVQVHDAETTLEGDPTLLGLLVRNLLENALTHGRSARGVEVALRASDADVTLDVRDFGVGIPESHRGEVFQPLYRVDDGRSRTEGGAGLGLSIVRAICRAHGGEVTLHSETGGGTTVRVVLPRRGD